MATAELAADLLLALDPVRFARERLHFNPDGWQAQALRSRAPRSLWNCTRQGGKSTTAAIVALHRAIYHPQSTVLLVSPSLRQSSELFRKVADLLGSLADKPKLTEENKLSLTMDNRSRIVSLPGAEATVRGYSGAALIIEDEAARVDDALYMAMRPMLAVSGGRLLLMSTPFGKRGHFFKEWTEGGDGWERVEVTARDCPRISPAFLADEERSLGGLWFRQEYLCEFVDDESHVFNYELVMGALRDDIEPLFGGGA